MATDWDAAADPSPAEAGLTRRHFVAGVAGVAGAAVVGQGWRPADRIPAGSSKATLAPPPRFPRAIRPYQQAYRNWSGEIRADAVWTCSASGPADVVTLANWAHANGWTIRPRGSMHGWTPLTIVARARPDKVLLVDTTAHLRSIEVAGAAAAGGGPATVTCGAGALLEAVLQALEDEGLGWTSVPAPGDITIAGALAVNAHGAAVPAHGEHLTRGSTYGSLSNLVTALTAVVWDEASDRFVLRTFTRADPETPALLVHLGRAFLTEVTMQAGRIQRIRCQSRTDIPTGELFGPPGTRGRTFAGYLAAAGRVEAIWFPFTDRPWLKVWTPTPSRPATSKAVTGPYNFPFSDRISLATSDLLEQRTLADPAGTPDWGRFQLSTVQKGLATDGASDFWGWSKDVLLYIRPTTIRMSEGGGAVITRRADVQQVVHAFTSWYGTRIKHLQAQGRYPINGPVEIRCCGLDQPTDVLVPSAGPPTLSSLRPRPDRPEWDTAVWLNVLGIPGTPGMWDLYGEIEDWMTATFAGGRALFRPEWSKGWAFSAKGPYTDGDRIRRSIPATYRTGYPDDANWDSALRQLDALDPHRVFSNSFMDQLLP